MSDRLILLVTVRACPAGTMLGIQNERLSPGAAAPCYRGHQPPVASLVISKSPSRGNTPEGVRAAAARLKTDIVRTRTGG